MPESASTGGERTRQPKFSISQLLSAVAMLAAALIAHALFEMLPNRVELGPRVATVRFAPVTFDPKGFGPFQLLGAWQVTADDRRFQGVSALAVDGAYLLALTDSGVLVRLPKPGATAHAQALIAELPAGPGDPLHKPNRDTEALLRDEARGGWWIAFENRHELWKFDQRVTMPELRVRLRPKDWRRNLGIEGMVATSDGLLLFPEPGRSVLHIAGTQMRAYALRGVHGRVSDAATLPDGRIFLVERSLGLGGFSNALLVLRKASGAYVVTNRFPLPVGRLDNVEAIAAETSARGSPRLWLMTDDNGQRPLRTLLIALELPERVANSG